jgi:hypothetical protein
MGPKINVEVRDDRLIVTMLGTCFSTTYLLAPDTSMLMQSNVLMIDGSAGIISREFEQLAWEAAYAKARDLGWIVEAGLRLR